MEELFGALVGAFVIYRAYKRLRYVRAHMRLHKQSDKFEQALREARERASGPTPWRKTTPADARLVAQLDNVREDVRTLETLGFRVLGDLVAQYPATEPRMPTRVLVSDDQMIVAGLTLSGAAPKQRSQIWLTSYTPNEQLNTRKAKVGSLAAPPFVRENIVAGAAIDRLIAEHRAKMGADTIAITGLDDVLAQSILVREKTQAWRAAQPSDELLDADLKAMLGPAYETTGKIWAATLRAKLPEARLRPSDAERPDSRRS